MALGRNTSRFRRRWLDVVTSIYIYNEHRGYTALDTMLLAVRKYFPHDRELIEEVSQHRADERKHYLMFKRWFQKRGTMPLLVDRTCGHIDRFFETVFRSRIDDVDVDSFIARGNFEQLCRVISLTERRGFWQVEILLRHPTIRADRMLTKIFQIIKRDEPRHWAPYERWLKAHGCREPAGWERAIDSLIHSELLLAKLPILFLSPGLKRRSRWADDDEQDANRIAAISAPPEQPFLASSSAARDREAHSGGRARRARESLQGQ